MKILIEGKTIQVNASLQQNVNETYLRAFTEYKKELKGIKTPMFKELGHLPALKNIRQSGDYCFLVELYPLAEWLKFDADPILRRKQEFNQEILTKKLNSLPNSTITLAFWIDNPDIEGNNDAIGRFHKETNDGYFNVISIRFPWGQAAFMPGLEKQMLTTIRHELQHFTQAFYSNLLDTKRWIGLPPPNAIKGMDTHGDTNTKHQDIPIEVATDLQDEIDDFLIDLKGLSISQLKQAINNFVGIGNSGYQSSLFQYYFQHNKDIWKWGVSKLLSSVKAL